MHDVSQPAVTAGEFEHSSDASLDAPLLRPLHTCVPGRVRVAVSGLRGSRPMARWLETSVSLFPGVRGVKASSTTGNAIILFTKPISLESILAQLAATVRHAS